MAAKNNNEFQFSWRGEDYLFSLWDPDYQGEGQVSENAIFHLRSNRSGDILPYMSLREVKDNDPEYFASFTNTMRNIITQDDKEEYISRLFPVQNITMSPSPSDTNISLATISGDYPFARRPGRDALEKHLRATDSIDGYLNRFDMYTSSFSAASKLHSTSHLRRSELSASDYQAVMSAFDAYFSQLPEDRKILNDYNDFVRNWSQKAQEHEGTIEFSDVAYISTNQKRGFQSTAKHLYEDLLIHCEDAEMVIEATRAMKAISHLNDNNMVRDRLIDRLAHSVPAPRDGEAVHPATQSLAEMVFKEHPHIPLEEALAYPVFSFVAGQVRDLGHDRDPWHARAIAAIARGGSPEAERNTCQFLARMHWDGKLTHNHDTSSLTGQYGANALLNRVYEGQPLNRIVRDMLDRNRPAVSDDADRRKLPKRTMNLLLDNAHAMDALSSAARRFLEAPETHTLRTLSGERIEVTKHKSELNKELGTLNDNTTRIRFFNKHEQLVFDTQDKPLDNMREFNYNLHLKSSAIFDNVSPVNVTQLPPDKITSYEELRAVFGALSANKTLNNKNTQAFFKHNDRKIRKMDYLSWVDQVVKHAHDIDKLDRYLKDHHLSDAEEISQEIMTATLLHYAERSGISVTSPVTTMDFATDNAPDVSESFAFDGVMYMLNNMELSLKDNDAIDKYTKLLELSDDLHKHTNLLKKSYGPTVDLSWPACTEPLSLGLLEGQEITIEPLNSYTEINNEGTAMSHCAGTYASQCMKGQYYLFSIKADGERLATLGMDHSSGMLEFDQLYGHGNRPVSHDLERLVRPYCDALVNSAGGLERGDYDWGYDDEEEEEYKDVEPMYDAEFTATRHDGDDNLSPSEVAEMIANYHFRAPDFGERAMALMTKTFGRESTVQRFHEVIDGMLEEIEPGEETLRDRLKQMRSEIGSFDRDSDMAMRA